jgi:hypothetical protein
MKCETCSVELGMYALSDKPDPGYGYLFHTWEQCARNLLIEAKQLVVEFVPEVRLPVRIAKLLAEKDNRLDLVREAIERVARDDDR